MKERKLRRAIKRGYVFNPKECEILSIRRMSDGVVFRINDALPNGSIIRRFYPTQEGISLQFDNKLVHGSCVGTLNPK